MKAIVDKETCIGCGLCAQTCPDVFKMDDDKSIVYVDKVPNGQEELAKQAADECPVNAIKIE